MMTCRGEAVPTGDGGSHVVMSSRASKRQTAAAGITTRHSTLGTLTVAKWRKGCDDRERMRGRGRGNGRTWGEERDAAGRRKVQLRWKRRLWRGGVGQAQRKARRGLGEKKVGCANVPMEAECASRAGDRD